MLANIKLIPNRLSLDVEKTQLASSLQNKTWVKETNVWLNECEQEYQERMRSLNKTASDELLQCCRRIHRNVCFEKKCHAERDVRCAYRMAEMIDMHCMPMLDNASLCHLPELGYVNTHGLRMLLYSKCYIRMEVYLHELYGPQDMGEDRMCCLRKAVEQCYNGSPRARCLQIDFGYKTTAQELASYCDLSWFGWDGFGRQSCRGECDTLIPEQLGETRNTTNFVIYVALMVLTGLVVYLSCCARRLSPRLHIYRSQPPTNLNKKD